VNFEDKDEPGRVIVLFAIKGDKDEELILFILSLQQHITRILQLTSFAKKLRTSQIPKTSDCVKTIMW
jgi:hypothetical protein